MQQNSVDIRNIGLSFIVAVGLLTTSSNTINNSTTTINIASQYSYEMPSPVNYKEPIYTSSKLYRQTIGDVFGEDQLFLNTQMTIRLQTSLYITKIREHVPTFDFDEEYEEI